MPPETNSQFKNPLEDAHQGKKVWLLIIFGFILIIINVYFLWNQSTVPIGPNDPVLKQKQNLTVASTTDQFADWKTYRNEEYGFEFKYPDDFSNFSTISINEPGHQNEKVYFIKGLDFTFDASGTNWPSNEYRMFGIGIWPIDYWDQYMIVDINGKVNDKKYPDEPGPIYISKNTEFAFTYYKSQDCPDKYCKAYKEVSQVFSTFKFTK